MNSRNGYLKWRGASFIATTACLVLLAVSVSAPVGAQSGGVTLTKLDFNQPEAQPGTVLVQQDSAIPNGDEDTEEQASTDLNQRSSELGFRVFEAGSSEDGGEYKHCVVQAVSDEENPDELVLGSETCFVNESSADEFAIGRSTHGVSGATGSKNPHILGKHYTGLDFSGRSLTITGTKDCEGGGITLSLYPRWNNVIKSTSNGCSRIAHYSESQRFIFRGELINTTGVGGNIIFSDISAGVSGIRYYGTLNKPVRLVALEVTQGLQDWNNSITLVKGRKTFVRAFFETLNSDETSQISGRLHLDNCPGQTLPSSSIGPLNHRGVVLVSSNPADPNNRVNYFSSLNFSLPGIWSQCNGTATLRLQVIGASRTACNEGSTSNASLKSCSATILIQNVLMPKIKMVRLGIERDHTLSRVDRVTPQELREQFYRIYAVMPIPNREFDIVAGDIEDDLVHSVTLTGAKGLADLNERMNTFRLYDAVAVYGLPRDALIYLGVLPDRPNSGNITGQAGFTDGRYAIPGSNASWFTIGLDRHTDLGYARNNGSHELSHLFGRYHTIDSSDEVVCSNQVESNRELYPYIYSPTREDNDTNLVATLGPMPPDSTAYTEVWGLDIRFAEYMPYISNSRFVIISPYEVYSLLSYCDSRQFGFPLSQGVWMDRHNYQPIVNHINRRWITPASGFVGQESSRVKYEMFEGDIIYSNEKFESLELNTIFSFDSKFDVSDNETGDYILELRDASNAVVKSVAFETTVTDSGLQDGKTKTTEHFAFWINNPPEYDSIAVTKSGQTLTTIQASANSPTISITKPVTGQQVTNNSIEIAWTASDSDGDDLTYAVMYSTDGGETYSPIAIGYDKTSMNLNLESSPGSSQARFIVVASDGINSTFASSPIIATPQHMPEVAISAPVSGAVITGGQNFVLSATGYDIEDGSLPKSAFAWTSSLNGALGTGDHILLSGTNLIAGTHQITVTATDSSGSSVTATTRVTISRTNSIPVAIDDSADIKIRESVFIDVLANDTDTEKDIDLTTFTITEAPSLGVAEITVSSEGVTGIKYTNDTSGNDSFSYQICDGLDRCSTAKVRVRAGLADCTILGTEENDNLIGTTGNDIICGLGGDDTIEGDDGNDIIRGGAGNDSIKGGPGNDEIYGESGDDLINGNRGEDRLFGGGDNDEMYGSSGKDFLSGGKGDDELHGDSENDILEGGEGSDDLRGGHGDDTIRGNQGDDTIRGTAGNDEIYGGSGSDTINGGTGNDRIFGEDDPDVISAEDGDDFVSGGNGSDRIFGGNGSDTLEGNDGHDEIRGGNGQDTIRGGKGNDTIRGNAGADTIIGGEGYNRILGRSREDKVL